MSTTLVPDSPEAIDRILERADRLGVFPLVAMRVREVVGDSRSSLGHLERVVSMDPALVGQLLRLANSPCYGLARQVSSVRQAILVLGFRATRDLSLALSVAGLGREVGEAGQALWRHSVRAGTAARVLAPYVHVPAGEATVAGMLHNVGQHLLLVVDPDGYGRISGHVDGVHRTHWERERYGVSAEQLGVAALRRWGLPAIIVEGVRWVGAPKGAPTSEARRLAGVVVAGRLLERSLEGRRPATVLDEALRRGPVLEGFGGAEIDLEALAHAFETELAGW